jgi:hypothetical protein
MNPLDIYPEQDLTERYDCDFRVCQQLDELLTGDTLHSWWSWYR